MADSIISRIFAALESCKSLLSGFGGHELAAGFTIPEENIGAFRTRMNRYVRETCGGELPVSSLEVDAPITCPGAVTLAEVEELSRLEPYGAGNPRPVFALLGAMVDAVQPVGQGRHLKLHLSKGPCRFDAIFFSVTEAECGITAGSRVDVAFYLQANTFRGSTTLQLQLIDIRPSLTPSRHQAEDLALLGRLLEGGSLTAQEVSRLQITRDQLVPYWRVLERRLRAGKLETDRLPFLRQLARDAAVESGGSENFLRSALSLEIFRERGLLTLVLQGDRMTLHLNPTQGKVDLSACPYLIRLQEGASNRNRGDLS